MNKTCTKCKTFKPVKEFYLHPRSGKYRPLCMVCHRTESLRNAKARRKLREPHKYSRLELIELVRGLWSAIENGIIDKEFFKLREKVRGIK